MEWVIAILSIGCIFFVFQITFRYLKHKSVVASRLSRLEESRNELEFRIEEAKDELSKSRSDLGPAKKAVESLEQEYQSLQEKIKYERENNRRDRSGISGTDFDV
jgi:predicted  nucleic acid-binding Zn-ribbon protein|tara:strand:+ start:442 stop:756 length:315 start_codon:yes stop_codon:yes gene_type:complete